MRRKRSLWMVMIVAILLATSSALAQYTPIGDVQTPGPDGDASQMVGQTVTITGRVTVPFQVLSYGTFYVQDGTGGVMCYLGGNGTSLGDSVIVAGVVTEYNKETEIDLGGEASNLTIVGSGTPPTPLQLTTFEATKEAYEGRLIEVTGIVSNLGASGFDVDDGSGSIYIYIDTDTGIDFSFLHNGNHLSVIGVGTDYKGNHQLKARYQTDLILIGNTPPSISDVRYSPASPSSADTVTVTARAKDNEEVASVWLCYSINGGQFDSTQMLDNGTPPDTLQADSVYTAQILPQADGTEVSYYIRAADDSGLVSTDPSDAPGATYRYTVSNQPSTAGRHLLFSEVCVVTNEFVEIYNNTDSTIDLSNYYLTDAIYQNGDYYLLPAGQAQNGGNYYDFNARFPDGASIAPGEYQTIAIAGSEGFKGQYGFNPDYELCEDGPTPDQVPDMRDAFPGSIPPCDSVSLTNTGEVVILYYWDQVSDLVKDVDYVLWGDKAEAVDKSGIPVDGPDPDQIPSTYANDTPKNKQGVVAPGAHSYGNSWQRGLVPVEVGEVSSGGNGITGHDETSEILYQSFTEEPYTPGTGPPGGGGVGEAHISPSTVDADLSGLTETITLRSDSAGITLTKVKIEIPPTWTWGSPDSSGVALSGPGFTDSTQFTVGGGAVTIEKAKIDMENEGRIAIKNLTSPPLPQTSIFKVSTAYMSRGLEEIKSSPRVTVKGVGKATLTVPPHPFAPDLGERLEIKFSSPPGDHMVLKLFDLEGRVVVTLFDGESTGGMEIINWDGRNELFERVPIGVYILYLEATAAKTGKTTTAKAPVVVATRLD